MDLSILIPARNEQFLNETIDDILKNKRGKTDIIVGLDGQWGTNPIPQHKDVTVVFYPKSIGQRSMTNRLAKLSKSKYVMKLDAHCAMDEGFDVKLMADMKDNWTVVPAMKNLHVFDWVCECGKRRYQGPTKPCECGKDMKKEMIWKGKQSPLSTSYRFNRQLEFKYFGQYKKKQIGDIVDTMSLQGSCFMCTRKKYWELDICDESWGSWGGQGSEVALKTWLSGGEVKCNKKTWYAHLFRTQGGDFGFPYANPGDEQKKAKDTLRDTFLNNKWSKAKHNITWLVNKFGPVPDWETNKGILFYTDNELNVKIAHRVQKQLKTIGLPITSVSLKPMPHFGNNIHLDRKRGYLTMFKQILTGLETMTEDIVYFCEHDVIYNQSHFEFTPEKRDIYYYNENFIKQEWNKDRSISYDAKQLSGLCCYRELAIQHYRKKVEIVEAWGYNNKIGFEPGTHNRKEKIDNYKSEAWKSKEPNIDIRHNNNLTPSRWSKDKFRNKPKNWKII